LWGQNTLTVENPYKQHRTPEEAPRHVQRHEIAGDDKNPPPDANHGRRRAWLHVLADDVVTSAERSLLRP
jgi:hypothetical protein